MARRNCEKSWRIDLSRLGKEQVEINEVAKNDRFKAQSYESAAASVLLIPPGWGENPC
jgi:hypothetical protein